MKFNGKSIFDISKCRKLQISLVIVFAFFLSGCQALQKREATPSISILNIEDISKVKIVDNFNKEDKNQLGGEHLTRGKGIKAEYRADPANEESPFLDISYTLDRPSTVFWETDLQLLDVSQLESFVFFCKIYGDTDPADVSFMLFDNHGKRVSFSGKNNLELFEKEVWLEIVIPREELLSLDLNALSKFRVSFSTRDEPVSGKIAVDSIEFIGEPAIYFHSLADNLNNYPKGPPVKKGATLLEKDDNEAILLEIARDTWSYFEDIVDRRTHLPLDYIKLDNPPVLGDFTSITNIGLYLISCVAASEMGFITEQEAWAKIERTLITLKKLERWEGFLYNYYNTTTLKPTSAFVSTVDSGWFAASLIIIRQTASGRLAKTANKFLNEMDFSKFYDEKSGQLAIGYDVAKDEISPFHYGVVSTEARLASLIGIGKGDLSRDHWYSVYRTLPESWKWQNQIPRGSEATYFDNTIFQGHYLYNGKKIVPSWGGSLFENLMPALLINEKKWAPKSFGPNNKVATKIHIDYALKEKEYPVWGISPCSISDGEYGSYAELGIPDIGAKGYPDKGIITPHVTFLAMDLVRPKAIDNIINFLSIFDMYGEYGFYDSVNVIEKTINYRYLALDQGMTFISLANFMKNNVIRNIFEKDPIFKNVKELLQVEDFNLNVNDEPKKEERNE